MEELRTDDEQVEALKKWWAENGKAIILGAIIGIGGLVGYQSWNNYKTEQARTASDLYIEVSQLQGQLQNQPQDKNKAEELVKKANLLLSDYSNTSYATLTQFVLAKYFVDSKQWDKAIAPLEAIIADNKQEGYVHLARIRLIGVLLQTGKLDKALQLTEQGENSFSSLYAELKGDILLAKGKYSAARTAYQAALNKADRTDQRKSLLTMKMNNIPVDESPVNTPADTTTSKGS